MVVGRYTCGRGEVHVLMCLYRPEDGTIYHKSHGCLQDAWFAMWALGGILTVVLMTGSRALIAGPSLQSPPAFLMWDYWKQQKKTEASITQARVIETGMELLESAVDCALA